MGGRYAMRSGVEDGLAWGQLVCPRRFPFSFLPFYAFRMRFTFSSFLVFYFLFLFLPSSLLSVRRGCEVKGESYKLWCDKGPLELGILARDGWWRDGRCCYRPSKR